MPRLWESVTIAIEDKNMEAATDAKSAIEEAQREQRRKREQSGERHIPRFFELAEDRWIPKLKYVPECFGWIDLKNRPGLFRTIQ